VTKIIWKKSSYSINSQLGSVDRSSIGNYNTVGSLKDIRGALVGAMGAGDKGSPL